MTDLTNLSANAFKLGERGGRRTDFTPPPTDRLTAKQALGEVLRDVAKVDHNLGKAVTVTQLIDLHMSVRATLTDSNTQKKLRYIRDTLVNTWPGKLSQRVRDVRRSDIERWIALHRNRVGAYGVRLSKGTLNEYIQFVRSLFQTAVDERVIARSPVEDIKNLRRDRPIRRTPTISEFRKIVADLRA